MGRGEVVSVDDCRRGGGAKKLCWRGGGEGEELDEELVRKWDWKVASSSSDEEGIAMLFCGVFLKLGELKNKFRDSNAKAKSYPCIRPAPLMKSPLSLLPRPFLRI